VRYSLFKNLGWVRLEQKRYEEAEGWLKGAIGLSQQPKAVKVVNPSSVHCLLAKVLERQKQSAMAEWQKCRKLGTGMNPASL
jgi:uncharacterized protein HemY